MRCAVIGASLLLTACSNGTEEKSSNITSDANFPGTAMVMLDSSRAIASGTDISLNDFIELTEGRQVDFHLSDGASVTLSGPVSGKLGTLLETDTQIVRWTKISTDMLNKSANEGHVLTVRSGGGDTVWLPFSIPVPFNGNFCIPSNTQPTLYRPGTSTSSLNFDLTQGNQLVPLIVTEGTNVEIAWPENLPLDTDIQFVNSAWLVKNTFKVIQLPDFDEVSLSKAGCTYHLEMMKRVVF